MGESLTERLIQANAQSMRDEEYKDESKEEKLKSLRLVNQKHEKSKELIEQRIIQEGKKAELIDNKIEMAKLRLEKEKDVQNAKLEFAKSQLAVRQAEAEKAMKNKENIALAGIACKLKKIESDERKSDARIDQRERELAMAKTRLDAQAETQAAMTERASLLSAERKARQKTDIKARRRRQKEWLGAQKEYQDALLEQRRNEFEYKKQLSQLDLEMRRDREERMEQSRQDRREVEARRREAQQRRLAERKEERQYYIDDLGFRMPREALNDMRKRAEYAALRALWFSNMYIRWGDLYYEAVNGEPTLLDTSAEMEKAAHTVVSLSRAQASVAMDIIRQHVPIFDEKKVEVAPGLVWDMEACKFSDIPDSKATLVPHEICDWLE